MSFASSIWGSLKWFPGLWYFLSTYNSKPNSHNIKPATKQHQSRNHSTQNKQEESYKGNDTGLLLNHDEQVRGLATKKARRKSGHIESWLRQLSRTWNLSHLANPVSQESGVPKECWEDMLRGCYEAPHTTIGIRYSSILWLEGWRCFPYFSEYERMHN